MKIRNSLVSNSSSASYTVTVKNCNLEVDDIYSMIWQEFGHSINIQELRQRYIIDIETAREGKKYRESEDTITNPFEDWKESERRLKVIDKNYPPDNHKKTAKLGKLVSNDISIGKNGNTLVIQDWTAMHNNYHDSVSYKLIEIVFNLMMSHGYSITGVRTDDN